MVAEGSQVKRALKSVESLCEIIRGGLPPFCTCAPTGTNFGGTVTCSVNLGGFDILQFTGEIEPCEDPMFAKVSIQETKLNISWFILYT